MKTEQIYSGEQIRQWRHRLGVSLRVEGRISHVNTSVISYVERGASGAELTRVKIARALSDIETVIEQRRPVDLNTKAIEQAVSELRKRGGYKSLFQRREPTSVGEGKVSAFAK